MGKVRCGSAIFPYLLYFFLYPRLRLGHQFRAKKIDKRNSSENLQESPVEKQKTISANKLHKSIAVLLLKALLLLPRRLLQSERQTGGNKGNPIAEAGDLLIEQTGFITEFTA
jgi:hypothetical protein